MWLSISFPNFCGSISCSTFYECQQPRQVKVNSHKLGELKHVLRCTQTGTVWSPCLQYEDSSTWCNTDERVLLPVWSWSQSDTVDLAHTTATSTSTDWSTKLWSTVLNKTTWPVSSFLTKNKAWMAWRSDEASRLIRQHRALPQPLGV